MFNLYTIKAQSVKVVCCKGCKEKIEQYIRVPNQVERPDIMLSINKREGKCPHIYGE